MSDTQTLTVQLNQMLKELNLLIDEKQIERGNSRAETERNYRMRSQQKVLTFLQQGYKVTIIDALVKGDKEVAKLRFERDKAEVLYQNTLEKINILKLQIRVASEQLNREWGNAKYD